MRLGLAAFSISSPLRPSCACLRRTPGRRASSRSISTTFEALSSMYSTEPVQSASALAVAGANQFVGAIAVGARLDAGDVEHFVDQAQQVLAAAQDVVDAVGLIRRQAIEVEELRESHDGVQRGAQVVAHAREELALGAVRAVGRLAGPLQIRVRGDQLARALDDARLELRIELPQLGFGRRAAPAFLGLPHRALDGGTQLVEPIFEDVIGGAALQSLDGSLFANRARHEHERHVGAARCARLCASSPPKPGME